MAKDAEQFFSGALLLSLYCCVCCFNSLFRYKEAKAKGVDNYDRELEDAIDRLIVECDRKIGRALKRLQEEDAKAAIAISVTEVTQVDNLILNSFVFFFNSGIFLIVLLFYCSHLTFSNYQSKSKRR